jgi:hypothetical protein
MPPAEVSVELVVQIAVAVSADETRAMISQHPFRGFL